MTHDDKPQGPPQTEGATGKTPSHTADAPAKSSEEEVHISEEVQTGRVKPNLAVSLPPQPIEPPPTEPEKNKSEKNPEHDKNDPEKKKG